MSAVIPEGKQNWESIMKHHNSFILAGVACLGAILPVMGRASEPIFIQQVQHARLYMTHYAMFEEPDPGVLPGIYIDSATGMPAPDLNTLTPPLESFITVPNGPNPGDYVIASSAPVKQLPYGVSPPGFPAISPSDSVITAIDGVLGGAVPKSVIQANTSLLLVAIGQFAPTKGAITAQRDGANFSVTRDTEFQVRVRFGYIFQPPPGYAVPPVGIVVWLTRGLVDLLIGVTPDPATENDIVVYDWHATMTLSTENSYIRPFAGEPHPVVDPFPAGTDAIQFIGSPVDSAGNYTIVGHAEHVHFEAPTELLQFLFHTNELTDVEFAVEETGVLADPSYDVCALAAPSARLLRVSPSCADR